MNTQNLEFLQNSLKYLGFDTKLNEELAKKMETGSHDFDLKHETVFNKDELSSTLHFKKSDQSDMYFFNKYDASLKTPEGNRQNSFYVNKNSSITLKEAFNLLNGRAVNKDLQNKQGEKYNAWVQLDLTQKDKNGNYETKQFHSNYGYDLRESLSRHPVKELEDPKEKTALIKSLEKGNIQSVTFIKDGKEEKMFLEANPQFKTLNVYDEHMKRELQESHKDLSKGNSELKEKPVTVKKEEGTEDIKQDKQKDMKQTTAVKNDSTTSQKKTSLPKKHISPKKGMKV